MGCAEGCSFSENITVPDTKVNFYAWTMGVPLAPSPWSEAPPRQCPWGVGAAPLPVGAGSVWWGSPLPAVGSTLGPVLDACVLKDCESKYFENEGLLFLHGLERNPESSIQTPQEA